MIDVKKIRELIASSDVAKVFFEHLATRIKNYRVTTVDHAMRLTDGRGRREIVELFKQMEALGLGKFTVGRRSGVSRFEWSVGMVETAQAAFGETDEIESLDSSELEIEDEQEEESEEARTESTKHSFVLRPGAPPITFALPSDLSIHEAERLSRFILCLPVTG